MQKGKLYIIRHGQTDWNLKRKLQGRTDINLNEQGIQMAQEARERYKDIDINVCYTSPLKRAYETAFIIMDGRGREIIADERLREMSFGDYEGIEGLVSTPGNPIYTLFNDPVNYIADKGAESLEELYARTGEFINEILLPELDTGRNVLVVGHGAMNLSIVNRLTNIPLEHFWDGLLGNCELMEVNIY